MMNPVWKEKWLAALRGGEYQQTQGALKKDDGFCCLGVLCDIVRKSPEGEGMKWGEDGFFVINGSEHGGFLPKPIQDVTGVDDMGRTNVGALSIKNDTNSTFAEIADIIEKEL